MAKRKYNKSVSECIFDLLSNLPIFESAKLTVQEVADRLELNRSHLSRSFSRDQGISLEKYLLNLRMTHVAIYLVTQPRVPVHNVAKLFGFCRCDYFIRVFKKTNGITPGKFREMYVSQIKGVEDER